MYTLDRHSRSQQLEWDLEFLQHAVVRSRINGKCDIIPELQSLGNACEPLNYTVMAPEDMSGILVQLRAEGSSLIYGSIKYLNLTTLKCPQGFVLQHFKCKCHRMLEQASIQM